MNFFLYFCLIYSVTVYAQRTDHSDKVKQSTLKVRKALDKNQGQ